jgi:hypothetical protein
VDDDQHFLTTLVKEPQPEPPPAATLRDLLGEAPSLDAVAHAIFSAVATDDPSASPLDLDRQLLDGQSRLAAHFADAAWTWRR